MAVGLQNLPVDFIPFLPFTQGLNRNMNVENSFSLHVTFEAFFTNLILKVEAITERIAKLGSNARLRVEMIHELQK